MLWKGNVYLKRVVPQLGGPVLKDTYIQSLDGDWVMICSTADGSGRTSCVKTEDVDWVEITSKPPQPRIAAANGGGVMIPGLLRQ